MGKIKKNLELFIKIWGIVILINQVVFFGACLNPVCLIAALPHTGAIAFFIMLNILKKDSTDSYNDNEVDNKDQKTTVNSVKKETINKSADSPIATSKKEISVTKTSSVNSPIQEKTLEEKNRELLENLKKEHQQLNKILYNLKLEKENILYKIEQFRYKQYTSYGSMKLQLLYLRKNNSEKEMSEYKAFFDVCEKYKKYIPQNKKTITQNNDLKSYDNFNKIKLNIKLTERAIEDYGKEIKKLKQNENYTIAFGVQDIDKFLDIKKKKIELELNKELKSTERTGLKIVKKAHSKINKDIQKSTDKEIEKLKKELKSLESNLQKLTEQKIEHLNDIEEFNTQYNLHLGKIIKEILELKKEILYKQTIKQQKSKQKYQEDIQTFQETKETIDDLNSTISELEEALETIDKDDENYDELSKAYKELKEEVEKLENELESQEEELEKTKEFIEDETIKEEYEEVKSHYKEYENEYNHIQKEQDSKIQINKEEKKELKSLFRKAARLCHPDIVIDKLKEKAHELMQNLNEAYNKQDLVQVKKILLTLESGENFEVSSQTIEDKELLKQKITEYKDSIKDIESELEEIKEDDTFQTISKLDSWDKYFEESKSGLEVEKEKLEDETMKVLDDEKEDISTDIENNEDQDVEIDSLNIELTASYYLKSNHEKETRDKLFSNSLLNPTLSLEHEQNNTYDSLAIKILCDDTMIGYVLKHKNEENINNFCFKNNQLRDLYLVYENDTLTICSSNNDKTDNSTSVNDIGDGMYINEDDKLW